MGVFDTDGKTPLTFIDLGQFQIGSGYYFPGHIENEPTIYYFVNNTDQQTFWVNLDVEGVDKNKIQFDFYIRRGDQLRFDWFGYTIGPIYPYGIVTRLENSDPNVQFAYWFFKVTITPSQTEFGTFTPTIIVRAYDSVDG